MSLFEPGSGYAGLEVEYARDVSHSRDDLETFDFDDDEPVENMDKGSEDEDAEAEAELAPGQAYPG